MAKLLATLQGVALREVSLSEEVTTIGRRSRNRLVLDTRGVSGEHAVVRRCGADFHIEDLGSTNGTLVNGRPVKKRVLRSGDSIEIGEYRLKFLADSVGDSTNGDADHDTSQSQPSDSFDPAPKTIQIPPAVGFNEIPAPDWPRLRILSGANAGREYRLRKEQTRLGRPGHETAVITRRPNGYFIEHHRGEVFPMVNGVNIGSAARQLADHDVIEVADVTITFLDDGHSAALMQRSQLRSEPVSPAAISAPITSSATTTIPTPRGTNANGDYRPPNRLGQAPVQNSPPHIGSNVRRVLPQVAIDRLRNALNIRTARSIPKRGPRPNAGARIFSEDIRMTVQAGIAAELWRWLQDAGWREITYRPDRRHYCEIPTECVSELIECAAEERRRLLDSCIERAREGRLQVLAAPQDSNR